MSGNNTINGVPVTEVQIEHWADEAEAGFDVTALKKRGRGRPGRGSSAAQLIGLRLTPEELTALDEAAARRHLTRSEAIREALSKWVA